MSADGGRLRASQCERECDLLALGRQELLRQPTSGELPEGAADAGKQPLPLAPDAADRPSGVDPSGRRAGLLLLHRTDGRDRGSGGVSPGLARTAARSTARLPRLDPAFASAASCSGLKFRLVFTNFKP